MKACPNCNNSTMNFMKTCPLCKTELDDSCIITFGEAFVRQAKGIQDTKAQEKARLKERIEQMDRDGVAYCPKCYSTSLTANKKGFGIGKAVIGAAIVSNPIGLIAGNINAKKVRVTCLKCGNQFMAGKN